jgi:hypothetical protein
MNHEPECTNKDDWFVEGCWVCQPLRAAYQRGREDAAKDVIVWRSTLYEDMVTHIPHEDLNILCKELDDAVQRICTEWNVDGTENSL